MGGNTDLHFSHKGQITTIRLFQHFVFLAPIQSLLDGKSIVFKCVCVYFEYMSVKKYDDLGLGKIMGIVCYFKLIYAHCGTELNCNPAI